MVVQPSSHFVSDWKAPNPWCSNSLHYMLDMQEFPQEQKQYIWESWQDIQHTAMYTRKQIASDVQNNVIMKKAEQLLHVLHSCIAERLCFSLLHEYFKEDLHPCWEQSEQFICRAQVPIVLHTLSLASQCIGYSASYRQQASGCCILFSLVSHTLHVMGQNQPPDGEDNTWGEASNNYERNVMYYCCFILCCFSF